MAREEEVAKLLRAAEKRALADLNFKEAVTIAEQALCICEEDNDEAGRANALHAVLFHSWRLAERGKIPATAVLQLAGEELKIAREAGNKRMEACMLLLHAEINTDKRGAKKRDEALACALGAASIFHDLGDKLSEAAAQHQVSSVYLKLSAKGASAKASREAARHAEQALAITKELGDRVCEAKALHNLSVARWQGNAPFKDGMLPAAGALRIWRSEDSKRLEGFELHSIATWHLRRDRAREGVQYAEDALRVWRELGDSSVWEANTVGLLSALYGQAEQPKKAVEVAEGWTERFRNTGNHVEEALGLQMLAVARLQDADGKGAFAAVEEALTLCKQEDITEPHKSSCLHVAAEVYFQTDHMVEAVESFEKSLEMSVKSGDIRHQAYTLLQQARFHLLSREPDRGLDCAEMALELFQNSGNKTGEGFAHVRAGVAHLLMRRPNQAGAAAELARGIFIESQDLPNQAITMQLLAEVHKAREDPEAALKATNMARSLHQRLGDRLKEATMLVQAANLQHLLAINSEEAAERHRHRRGPAAAAAATEAEEVAGQRWDASFKLGREALQLARRLQGREASSLMANAHAAVAHTQGICGMYNEALKSASSSLDLWKDLGDPTGEVASLVLMGEIHRMNDHMEEAEACARQAQDLAERIKHKPGLDAAVDLLWRMRREEDDEGDQPAAPAHDARRPAAAAPEAPASAAAPGPPAADRGPSMASLVAKVTEMALELLQTDTFDIDQPLMDAGLDSLSLVQFRNILQKTFPGVPMPASLLFDNPSIRAVSENVHGELRAIHDRR